MARNRHKTRHSRHKRTQKCVFLRKTRNADNERPKRLIKWILTRSAGKRNDTGMRAERGMRNESGEWGIKVRLISFC